MRLLRGVLILALIACAILWLLYPALHECGHLAAAYLTGGGVAEASLLRDPHVTLRADGSVDRMMFIAACGGWFPLLLLALPDRFYYLHFAKVTAALMSALCGAVSAAQGILYLMYGAADGYDDAVLLLQRFPQHAGTVFLLLAVQIAAAAGYLLRAHPIRRMVGYYAVPRIS